MDTSLAASILTLILTLSLPSVMMVRARRVESESEMTFAVTAMKTAISAVHWKAARALFRFRKFRRAGWHDRSAFTEVQAT